MPDFPPISIVMPTMNREELLGQTLTHLAEYLCYSGEVRFVIGNDGESGLAERLGQFGFLKGALTVVEDGTRHGLGGNINRALRACQTDIVLQTQDDYFLRDSIFLDEHVQKLLEDESAGWIRLRLTQGQNFTATVEHRYWKIDWHSLGMYIASDQPHLKHMRFHSYYGFYPEGLRVGDTENSWVGLTKNLGQQHPEWPGVLIPCNLACDHLWTHEGDDCSLKDAGF
jgi:glycosyltransferase involved in cell wall biosynthesis